MMREQAIAREDSGLSALSSAYSGSQCHHLCQKAVDTALSPILGLVSEMGQFFSQEMPLFRLDSTRETFLMLILSF